MSCYSMDFMYKITKIYYNYNIVKYTSSYFINAEQGIIVVNFRELETEEGLLTFQVLIKKNKT